MIVTARAPTLVDRTERLRGVESAHERQVAPDDIGLEVVYSDGSMERMDGWTLAAAEGGPFRAMVTHPQSSYGHETLDDLEALRQLEREGVPSVRGRTTMGSVVETGGYMKSAYATGGLGLGL